MVNWFSDRFSTANEYLQFLKQMFNEDISMRVQNELRKRSHLRTRLTLRSVDDGDLDLQVDTEKPACVKFSEPQSPFVLTSAFPTVRTDFFALQWDRYPELNVEEIPAEIKEESGVRYRIIFDRARFIIPTPKTIQEGIDKIVTDITLTENKIFDDLINTAEKKMDGLGTKRTTDRRTFG